jgi:hypothetical protein
MERRGIKDGNSKASSCGEDFNEFSSSFKMSIIQSSSDGRSRAINIP